MAKQAKKVEPVATQQEAAAAPQQAPIQMYGLGKKYACRVTSPRGQYNWDTWTALEKAVTDNGGKADLVALHKAVKPLNHAAFVRYAIRHGWLVAVQ